MKTKTYNPVSLSTPTYWASALINGNYSELSDDEIREILEWSYAIGRGFPEYAVHEGPGYWHGKLTDLSTYTFLA